MDDRDEGVLDLVAELLEADDARHACLFFRSDDRAADAGDFLALHGFGSGRPGDPATPVWLAVDELETRRALDEGEDHVAVVSVDAPTGPDALDRRHGSGRGGWVLLLPREVAHMRDVARRTGYRMVPAPPKPATPDNALTRLLDRIEGAVEREELPAYLAAMAPLFRRRAPEELAAAALLLLQEKVAEAPTAAPTAGAGLVPPAWVRLYVSLGEKDRAGPGDLLGAITGEAGIEGSRVGKIEIRDSFSIVEVETAVADRVIKALNGVTVRGRALRVDYDRGSRERATRRRPAPRRGGA